MDDVATGDLVEPPEWMPRTRKSAIRHANQVIVPIHSACSVFWFKMSKRDALELMDMDNDEGSGMEHFGVECIVPKHMAQGYYEAWIVLNPEAGVVRGHTGRLFAEDRPARTDR